MAEAFDVENGLSLVILDQWFFCGGFQRVQGDVRQAWLLRLNGPSPQRRCLFQPCQSRKPEIDRYREVGNLLRTQAFAFQQLEKAEGPRLEHAAIFRVH